MSNLSPKVNRILNQIASKRLVAVTSSIAGACCDCCESAKTASTSLQFDEYLSSGTYPILIYLCDEHFSEVLNESPGLAQAALKLQEQVKVVDLVNHPPHYKSKSGLEAIDVIEAFQLNFHTGAAAKYILRHEKKGDAITDLKKAVWYLEREIARRQQYDDTSS